jgi:NADPH2:quinone reductase
MRAVLCQELGPPSALVVTEVDPPSAGPGHIVVTVEAGVNDVDALFVQGRYQIKPALPFIPGSEIAGRVTQLGDGVESLRLGDRVLVMCGLGGFAEQVAVPAWAVSVLPAGLDTVGRPPSPRATAPPCSPSATGPTCTTAR